MLPHYSWFYGDMKIKLVRGGVFPITKDKNGRRIKALPKTGYPFPGTFQGEGKLLGVPVIFIRLSGCNLRCSWQTADGTVDICDTPYSSHHAVAYDEPDIADVVETVKNNLSGIGHIIISGGEPGLQPKAVNELSRELKKIGLHITLETNGVLFSKELTEYIDLFSISPKLSASTPNLHKISMMKEKIDPAFIEHHEKNRRNIDSIQQYINACHIREAYYDDRPEGIRRRSDKDFQLKFVISHEQEAREIRDDFLKHLHHFRNDDIVLMPLGSTREIISATYALTAGMAIENRWRFTPRSHIDLFNNTQYV